jgi:tRNA(Ile)-lysidine synthase
MALLQRVQRSLRARAPLGARIVVALSGGGDSVALLWLLHDLHLRGAVVLAGAAQLNHGLRGSDAEEDEAFCREIAARAGVPFVSERADVAARAREAKRSVEDTARAVRYAFFERAADALGAELVATAHTLDDQAETVLLRILRGAGTRGLRGIHPRAGRVVRPLLDCRRAELREYLAARGETFREDATNADVGIPRNRVRHQLIPFLQERFRASVVPILAREAELAARDEDFLHRQAIELADRIVLSINATEVRIDARALRAAHPALSSRVAAAALSRLAGSRPIAFHHVDRLLWLAADGHAGAAISLPGQYAVRVHDEIVLRPGARQAAANAFAVSLSIPGEVRVDGWAVSAASFAEANGQQTKWLGRGAEVGVAAAALELPLVIRSRRPGDRFRPLGAPGTRKLQEFLVDRKILRDERDTLPLVVDANGRIVWVPGQAIGHAFRVVDPSQGVILLRVRRLGPAGAGEHPD